MLYDLIMLFLAVVCVLFGAALIPDAVWTLKETKDEGYMYIILLTVVWMICWVAVLVSSLVKLL